MTMTFTIILRLRVFVQMVGKEEPLKNIEYLVLFVRMTMKLTQILKLDVFAQI